MGKIEKPNLPGQTPLDDISGLIPKNIVTQEQLNVAEFANINKAMLKYFTKKLTLKTAPLKYEWLMKLHHEMLGEVWRWAGKPRKTEKSVGVKPYLIGQEIHRFEKDLEEWENGKMPIVEIAARIHHRLVQIHPFENGNGRWARIVTNIYLRKKGFELILWPEEQMFVANEFREKYISALKAADLHDYQPLIELHHQFVKTN
ncbi:MAG: hypothetical protein A3G33_06000 [Omnitrophica bacterium RIFCSPLOWO2_12_FULL_44_17]|uniref:Fido domain-containing protein n=1 Tax=Candidatus Danuiimicrobium aquiferis TaxID=1801832 RepID=A0A1G1L2H0_9BACT|nr:MAG: hypothetical protein A3B72_06230 [Omnitrophica bacterium RIFCSPHIGHO2_02_FULL_45_28]OGW89556.1 MAG: hypothetical protein A3E74_09235 [Omnitrophica bacterium RIFCSPHIGHO2_12_FULL_44_12]OGW99341.1 MAG: hypothetical protein A3G33_06000 [Omnitrophica bacterium RIFCSPLOWO2_12_FULL_44_17]OGX05103.1 MAG: hypothetical protein A3J12_06710 [Omnitrophica bacterium RIFCSPLOWO2_02_FULL_44_11]